MARYRFRDPQLLEEALTHGSLPGTRTYQRLEFLGDAVMKTIQSHDLFVRHEAAGPGELTVLRQAIEGKESMARWCRELGLDKEIRYGKGFSPADKGWHRVCADVFEAYVGAVFIDSGGHLEAVKGALAGLC